MCCLTGLPDKTSKTLPSDSVKLQMTEYIYGPHKRIYYVNWSVCPKEN
ncbi:hypothetical protein AHF37_12753, partial [Paragonimus kellicotti]